MNAFARSGGAGRGWNDALDHDGCAHGYGGRRAAAAGLHVPRSRPHQPKRFERPSAPGASRQVGRGRGLGLGWCDRRRLGRATQRNPPYARQTVSAPRAPPQPPQPRWVRYQIPDVIGRCAAFISDHVLPRLACATNTHTACCAGGYDAPCGLGAAEQLLLPLSARQPRGAAAAGQSSRAAGTNGPAAAAPREPGAAASEWVLQCLDLALRLDLEVRPTGRRPTGLRHHHQAIWCNRACPLATPWHCMQRAATWHPRPRGAPDRV